MTADRRAVRPHARRALVASLALVAAVGASRPARADEPLDPERVEVAGAPLVGGSTDIGVGAGVLGVLAKFAPGYYPYRWRLEVKAFAAFTHDPDGDADLSFHDHHIALDVPDRAGRRLTVLAEVARDTAAGYWGLGSAAPQGRDDSGRRHQLVWLHPGLSLTGRLPLGRSLFVFAGAGAAYERIDPYDGSLLRRDLAAGGYVASALHGSRPHALGTASLGLALDTRDHETVPSRGMFHEISLRGGVGSDSDVRFGGADLATRFYAPIVRDAVVIATRAQVDLLFGRAPIYELSRIGGLSPRPALGGETAVRGVPSGRYAGLVKLLGDVEVRGLFPRLSVGRQRFRPGFVGFVDVGRVRADYGPHPELDAGGEDVKVGLGGGARLLWGETFLARFDVAWAREGTGVYVRTDHAF